MADSQWMVGVKTESAAENSDRKGWQLQGLYESEAQANRACANKDYFVEPVTVVRYIPRPEWNS